MQTDKRLSQITKMLPFIIYKVLFVFFLALYFDRNRINIQKEPTGGIVDFWGDSGFICHFPYWVSFRYSFVQDNVHYILRPDPVPIDIPALLHEMGSPNGFPEPDFYYGLGFDLPEYIQVPYSGPDTPFYPAKVDSEELLKEEEINVQEEHRLRVA